MTAKQHSLAAVNQALQTRPWPPAAEISSILQGDVTWCDSTALLQVLGCASCVGCIPQAMVVHVFVTAQWWLKLVSINLPF
jgi:hypothetical protein